MTKRSDIENDRLVYTCNCGFIDTFHATPDLAMPLLRDMRDERTLAAWPDGNTIEGRPAFVLRYKQEVHKWGLKPHFGRYFVVRKGLSPQRKKEVALAIFMEVSLGFEAWQESFPWSDSGFSAEDLMSDLIAFYMALLALPEPAVMKLCGAVSKPAALKVYDQNFPGGIGKVKVKRFLEPLLFPCDECKGKPQLPSVFRTLQPAKRNGDFVGLRTLPSKWVFGRPADFDRTGRLR